MPSAVITAKQVLQKFYAKLIHVIPVNDILGDLVSEGVITIDQKIEIQHYSNVPKQRAEYLLDNYISQDLSAGYDFKFKKLLYVMKRVKGMKDSGCVKVAASIQRQLLGETETNSPMPSPIIPVQVERPIKVVSQSPRTSPITSKFISDAGMC